MLQSSVQFAILIVFRMQLRLNLCVCLCAFEPPFSSYLSSFLSPLQHCCLLSLLPL